MTRQGQALHWKSRQHQKNLDLLDLEDEERTGLEQDRHLGLDQHLGLLWHKSAEATENGREVLPKRKRINLVCTI